MHGLGALAILNTSPRNPRVCKVRSRGDTHYLITDSPAFQKMQDCNKALATPALFFVLEMFAEALGALCT